MSGIAVPDGKGAAQCQIDLGLDGEGAAKFASYAIKYVIKGTGVDLRAKALQADEDDLIEGGAPLDGVAAHRWTHGMRGYQFFGLPKSAITAWDCLRKIKLASITPLPPKIAELAAICQQPKGTGAPEYLRRLSADLVLSMIKAPRQNRYGETGERIIGIKLTLPDGTTETHYCRPTYILAHTDAADALIATWEAGTPIGDVVPVLGGTQAVDRSLGLPSSNMRSPVCLMTDPML